MTAWAVSEAIARGAAPAPDPADKPPKETGVRYYRGHVHILIDPIEMREGVAVLDARAAIERGFVR